MPSTPGSEASADAPRAGDYRLSISAEGDILRVQVAGEVDAQAVRLAYWHEIVATARAGRFRKLLVIDRKKGRPASPGELAELAMAFREFAGEFDRIAVVEPTAVFLPAIEHAEVFGRSLGINVRIFAEPLEAERWLWFGSADD